MVVACSDAGDGDGQTDETTGTGGADPGTGGVGTGGTSTGGFGTGGATGGNGTVGGSGGLGTGGATGGSGTGGATGGAGTGGATGGAGTGGDGTGGDVAGDEFTLTSRALSDLGMFADINTCAGGMGFGQAIPLNWAGFPEGTMSFALTMIDITLVDGENDYLGCHSAFWNVPVSTTSMPDANWSSALSGAMSINNGYLGPCPNFGGGTKVDTYVFTLYAMPDATLSDPDVNAQAFGNIESCNAMRDALDAAAIESVTLTGTSNASN